MLKLISAVIRLATVAKAFTLTQLGANKTLSSHQDKVSLSENTDGVLDFSLQPTNPPSLASILSLGLKALSVNKSKQLVTTDLSPDNPSQYFKLVLLNNGAFALQHDAGCVGFGTEDNVLSIVSCENIEAVLKLTKGTSLVGHIPHALYDPLHPYIPGPPSLPVPAAAAALGSLAPNRREFTGFNSDIPRTTVPGTIY